MKTYKKPCSSNESVANNPLPTALLTAAASAAASAAVTKLLGDDHHIQKAPALAPIQ